MVPPSRGERNTSCAGSGLASNAARSVPGPSSAAGQSTDRLNTAWLRASFHEPVVQGRVDERVRPDAQHGRGQGDERDERERQPGAQPAHRQRSPGRGRASRHGRIAL